LVDQAAVSDWVDTVNDLGITVDLAGANIVAIKVQNSNISAVIVESCKIHTLANTFPHHSKT
jgi:hypothetical protein